MFLGTWKAQDKSTKIAVSSYNTLHLGFSDMFNGEILKNITLRPPVNGERFNARSTNATNLYSETQ